MSVDLAPYWVRGNSGDLSDFDDLDRAKAAADRWDGVFPEDAPHIVGTLQFVAVEP